MKKLSFLAAALVSAMTLFTSCLGNGGNEAEFSATGIVFLNDKAGFKQMVDVGSAYCIFHSWKQQNMVKVIVLLSVYM